jgi:hypothetical protein
MKRLAIILFAIALVSPAFSQTTEQLVEICTAQLTGATYLQDFQVQLGPAEPGKPVPVAKYSILLSQKTQYRFSVCNADNSQGKAIIQLFDGRGLIGSNYSTASGKDFPSFDIQIQKTGVYHVFISFQDGKQGTAVGIMSFVKRL